MADTRTAEEFRTWLENTTQLSPITIQNYVGIVRQFLQDQDFSCSIDKINQFLIRYTKGKWNTLATRGALLQFCKWYGLPKEEIEKVILLKDKGKKILYRKIKIQDIKSLINFFKPGIYKDIFVIQSCSGCRSIEAWFIEKGNIEFDTETGSARVQVIQKGGRSRVLNIALELAEPIFNKPEYEGKKYPFLKSEYQSMSREEIIKKHYSGMRVAYWLAWKAACEKAGLPHYASHDARRAVIRAITEKYGPLMAKKLAGHDRLETTLKYLDSSELDTLKAWREVWQ